MFGKNFKLLIGLTVALGLSACSTVPESVEVPPDTNLVPYQEVAMQPEQFKDSIVRWGGVVANIENHADATLLEVVHYPLRGYGRPVIGRESVGRFRVYVDGFLDPMVYQQGRTMTFAGQVLGIEEGQVGEHVYKFPTVHADGYYLWEDIDRIEIEHISVWPFPYGRHARIGWGYRGWYGWGAWPYHHTVKVRRKHDHHRNYGAPHSQGGNTTTPQSHNTEHQGGSGRGVNVQNERVGTQRGNHRREDP